MQRLPIGSKTESSLCLFIIPTGRIPDGLHPAGVRQDTGLLIAPDTAAHCA